MNPPTDKTDPGNRPPIRADPVAARAEGEGAAYGARFPVIEGSYLRDILEQPEAIRRARAGLGATESLNRVTRDFAEGRFRRVVLTGMGSSLHALYPLHLALNRSGVGAMWIETAELLAGFDVLYRRDTLLVVVSQSGESVEIANLLARAAEFGRVIGITNHEDSRLGRATGTGLRLHAGIESTVACKSYLTSLAVLHWLAALLGQGDVSEASRQIAAAEQAVERYLARWRRHVDQWLHWTDDIQCVFVTGRGASLATAGTAGLILKESTRLPAEGMSCAAFRHGPLEMIGPDVLVLVLAGDTRVSPLNRRLYEDILGGGGRAVWLANKAAGSGALDLPEVCPSLLPMVEILPVQMLSLALAARDGREAGRFEKASKVTLVE